MNYFEVTIKTSLQEKQEIIIALLEIIGYEGFEQTDYELKAYIKELDFDEEELKNNLQQLNCTFSIEKIAQQNWNEVWESNFEPVIIDNFVSIRAHFHQPITTTKYQLLITPKMSFGTGHHATTYSVMKLMEDIDFTNKSVFDFGTGTGILAILAEKLGASKILAVDYDDWCIENSIENIEQNNCTKIIIEKKDNASVNDCFDIVIANINKNIILDNFKALNNCCKNNSIVLLSGLLIEDETDIINASKKYNWNHTKTTKKGNWIAIQFSLAKN